MSTPVTPKVSAPRVVDDPPGCVPILCLLHRMTREDFSRLCRCQTLEDDSSTDSKIPKPGAHRDTISYKAWVNIGLPPKIYERLFKIHLPWLPQPNDYDEYKIIKSTDSYYITAAFSISRQDDCYAKVVDLSSRRSEIAAQDEIDHLSRLKHPNVLAMFFSFQMETQIWIITELQHGNLANLIKQHQDATRREHSVFCSKTVSTIVKQLCKGLSHIHGRGIIHRNINSENILVNSRGTVCISDFGAAVTVGPDGTNYDRWIHIEDDAIRFLAPEVSPRRNKKFTQKVDIWALGVVIVEMLLGIAPPSQDEHECIIELYMSILKGKTSVLRTLPVVEGITYKESLEELLNYCLKINSILRKSAQELLEHRALRDAGGNSVLRKEFFRFPRILAQQTTSTEMNIVLFNEWEDILKEMRTSRAAKTQGLSSPIVTEPQRTPRPSPPEDPSDSSNANGNIPNIRGNGVTLKDEDMDEIRSAESFTSIFRVSRPNSYGQLSRHLMFLRSDSESLESCYLIKHLSDYSIHDTNSASVSLREGDSEMFSFNEEMQKLSDYSIIDTISASVSLMEGDSEFFTFNEEMHKHLSDYSIHDTNSGSISLMGGGSETFSLNEEKQKNTICFSFNSCISSNATSEDMFYPALASKNWGPDSDLPIGSDTDSDVENSTKQNGKVKAEVEPVNTDVLKLPGEPTIPVVTVVSSSIKEPVLVKVSAETVSSPKVPIVSEEPPVKTAASEDTEDPKLSVENVLKDVQEDPEISVSVNKEIKVDNEKDDFGKPIFKEEQKEKAKEAIIEVIKENLSEDEPDDEFHDARESITEAKKKTTEVIQKPYFNPLGHRAPKKCIPAFDFFDGTYLKMDDESGDFGMPVFKEEPKAKAKEDKTEVKLETLKVTKVLYDSACAIEPELDSSINNCIIEFDTEGNIYSIYPADIYSPDFPDSAESTTKILRNGIANLSDRYDLPGPSGSGASQMEAGNQIVNLSDSYDLPGSSKSWASQMEAGNQIANLSDSYDLPGSSKSWASQMEAGNQIANLSDSYDLPGSSKSWASQMEAGNQIANLSDSYDLPGSSKSWASQMEAGNQIANLSDSYDLPGSSKSWASQMEAGNQIANLSDSYDLPGSSKSWASQMEAGNQIANLSDRYDLPGPSGSGASQMEAGNQIAILSDGCDLPGPSGSGASKMKAGNQDAKDMKLSESSHL